MTRRQQLTNLERAVDGIETLVRRNEMQQASDLLVKASDAVRFILQNAPMNTQARVLAADLSMLAGDVEAARQRYLDVLRSDEFNFRANLGLGRFYVMSRIWRQAAAYLEKAQRVAPPDRMGEVLRLLAEAYNGQGLRREAIETAQRAVSMENPPTLESLEQLVQLNLDGRQYEDAVSTARAMRSAAERDRSEAMGELFLLNRVVAATELESQALQQYYRSLHRRDARGQYSDELLEGKEAEAASVLYEWAVVRDRLGELSRIQDAFDQVVALEQAVGYEPQNSRYLLGYAGVLMQTSQLEKAAAVLQQLLQLDVGEATDANPADVRKNQETARQYLRQLGIESPAAGDQGD
jgi:predicted Zn-dependent protease